MAASHIMSQRKFIFCCETALMWDSFLIASSANILVILTSNPLEGLAVKVLIVVCFYRKRFKVQCVTFKTETVSLSVRKRELKSSNFSPEPWPIEFVCYFLLSFNETADLKDRLFIDSVC